MSFAIVLLVVVGFCIVIVGLEAMDKKLDQIQKDLTRILR